MVTRGPAGNAAEILTKVKSKTGEYREIRKWRITCDRHREQRSLAKAFTGPDDSGRIRTWWLTPERRKGGTGRPNVPAKANPVATQPGDPVTMLIAECPRCHAGWLLYLSDELPPDLMKIRAASQPWTMVIADGKDPASEWAAGDETTVVTFSEWVDGPGGIVRARFDTPVHGAVASD